MRIASNRDEVAMPNQLKMERAYIVEKDFNKHDFTARPLSMGDYEECKFNNCNFSNTDLSQLHFSDCVFTSCNLAMATLNKTALQNCRFVDCKLTGLHFETCNPMLFSVSFDKCDLNLCSFYNLKMPKTNFTSSRLKDADLAEADLSSAAFTNCDLEGAIFESTNLEKADFTTAINYVIDPEGNKVKGAKFSTTGLPGLLAKYQIEIE